MDLQPHFYFIISFLFFLCFLGSLLWPIKEARLLHCNDGKFLGWEDFFPRVNKEIHCGVFGHVGFFSGNLVFS